MCSTNCFLVIILSFTLCCATLLQDEHTEVLTASISIGTVSLSAEGIIIMIRQNISSHSFQYRRSCCL